MKFIKKLKVKFKEEVYAAIDKVLNHLQKI